MFEQRLEVELATRVGLDQLSEEVQRTMSSGFEAGLEFRRPELVEVAFVSACSVCVAGEQHLGRSGAEDLHESVFWERSQRRLRLPAREVRLGNRGNSSLEQLAQRGGLESERRCSEAP